MIDLIYAIGGVCTFVAISGSDWLQSEEPIGGAIVAIIAAVIWPVLVAVWLASLLVSFIRWCRMCIQRKWESRYE